MEEVGIERKETKGTRPNDVVSNLLSSSRGRRVKKRREWKELQKPLEEPMETDKARLTWYV